MTSVATFKTRDAPPAPTSLSRAILRDVLIVAAIGVVIWVGHRLGRVVVVLILALFLAYLIAPLVELAQSPVVLKGRSRRLPRGVAIAVVYLLLAAGISAGAAVLWPNAAQQLNEAIASAPQYTESFRLWERGWTRYYERLRIPLELRHSIDPGVELNGVAGAFIAVPVVALITVAARHWLDWRGRDAERPVIAQASAVIETHAAVQETT